MKINKAIIPMADPAHRALPFQHVTTGDARTMPIAVLHIEELLTAGVEQVALVTPPGSGPLFADLRARFGSSLVLIEQPEPLGFGDAVLCAESWVGESAFIVQVCDHVFVPHGDCSCTSQLVTTASREDTPVSAIQVTHESQLPYFGVVGGRRVKGDDHLYLVDTMIEKPTPTVAEEACRIPGLRHGNYLALFGTHALTPMLFGLLRERRAKLGLHASLGLTESLAELATRTRLMALEVKGQRIDIAGPFGLLRAQLALSLHGPRREEALHVILEQVAAVQASEQ